MYDMFLHPPYFPSFIFARWNTFRWTAREAIASLKIKIAQRIELSQIDAKGR